VPGGDRAPGVEGQHERRHELHQLAVAPLGALQLEAQSFALTVEARLLERAQGLEQRHAVAVRESHVDQRYVEVVLAGERQSALAIPGDLGLDVEGADDLGDVLRQRLVVVDDENEPTHASAERGAAAGRARTKLAPLAVCSSSIVPPCASRIRRQSASPSPLPFALVVKSASKIR